VTALLCQRFLLRRDVDGALSGRVS